MAIQMRRGLRKDFDPNKMLPGEWAVSIDSVTSNQIVWMCFAAGVCKRMGTYEDFQSMIAEIAGEIKADYVLEFNAIKAEIQSVANTAISAKNEVLIVKSDITNTYLPQIRQYVSDAQTAANTATSKANSAYKSAVLAESYAVGGTGTRNGENTDNAKYYADEARKSAENAAEIAGGDFVTKTGDASNTTVSFTKASTRLNIVSGEKQSVLFGKIKKWFADMTAAAFAQMISSYSDLMSNTVSGYLPDANAVKDGFDVITSELSDLDNCKIKHLWIGGNSTITIQATNKMCITLIYSRVKTSEFGIIQTDSDYVPYRIVGDSNNSISMSVDDNNLITITNKNATVKTGILFYR